LLPNDLLSYIPLLCIAVFAACLCVLLFIVKLRKVAKVSFVVFLSLFIIIFGCVRTVFIHDFALLSILFIVATALFIPYAVMLAFGKPKEKKVKEKKEDVVVRRPEAIVQDIKAEEISLVEQGRNFVAIASDSFTNEEGNQELLNYINRTCIDVAKADGGAILTVDDFDDVISVKSFIGDFPPPYKLPDDLPHKPIRVSTSFKYAQFPLRDNIFGEVASAGKAELISVPKVDDRIYQNGPEEFLILGSLIFVPLKLKGQDVVIGLIALSRNADKDPFSEEDFQRTQTLAGFAEAALRTSLLFKQYKEQQELTKESDIATKLQKDMFPKKIPAIPGVSFGSFIEQTSGVCSDVFDVIPARQDRTSFVLMDVAGKGVNSLMVMTMIRSMFRLIVNTTQTAGTILSWANRGICSESYLDHFASVALLNYDHTSHKVQLSSSGIIPVLRYNVTRGVLEKISIDCDPIGVEKASTYKDVEFIANKGDIIILYTDGVVEALNPQGNQYPVENITNIVRLNYKLSGKEIAGLIKSDIKKFVGTEMLHDDQTLLVVKIQ